jgi:hypothetical protein
MNAFLNTCTILSTIIAVLSIPSAAWAIREFHKILKPQGEQLASSVMSALHPDEDRILVRFDPARVSEKGTFENDISKFKLSVKNIESVMPYQDFLLADPRSVIIMCDKQIRLVLWITVGVGCAFLVAAVVGSVLRPPATHETTSWWNIAGGILLMAFAVAVLLGILKVALYNPWKIRNTAIAYLNYLAKNGIRIGFEFTKLRSTVAARDDRALLSSAAQSE